MTSAEHRRLHEEKKGYLYDWKMWGPYVSERAWATVREDYSESGDAWNYFTHDLARSKAYRWGDDGIAGFTDYYQTLIFALAFWNGKDPILKERLFGLNPFEGNHGEDVKECYFYLDATPTHSYMKYLYKYPQNAFPYDELLRVNHGRTTHEREYELIDTGIFNENRYFDIFIEYAKVAPEDICIRIEAFNRGPEPAVLHLLPHLWFRNHWSWSGEEDPIPVIQTGLSGAGFCSVEADSSELRSSSRLPFEYRIPKFYLYGDLGADLLYTNNETHNERVWSTKSSTPYVKDAFHRYIIDKENCISPDETGTKVCFHYKDLEILPGESKVIHLRLTTAILEKPLHDVDKIVAMRKQEADEYYNIIQEKIKSEEDKKIQRQALAGMLWSKQLYLFGVERWLLGDNPKMLPPESRFSIRNFHWLHLYSINVISMPDKWEYPWFAAWDLALQSIAIALVDFNLAKAQLHLLLRNQFQHPNGQLPAYEWSFSDLNPPAQAWAILRLHNMAKKRGKADYEFLKICFQKLVVNFSWWVNKVDRVGNNFFEGGFLGLDNISVIDRSKPLPGGGYIEQSDGTGWMGFYSLIMMQIALELAEGDPIFEGMAFLYFSHFVYIAAAMQQKPGHLINRAVDMWDEEDQFFYDMISFPNGCQERLKVRSFVGVIPLYSIDFLDEKRIAEFPSFRDHFHLFINNNPELVQRCVTKVEHEGEDRYILSLMNLEQMQQALKRVWRTDEFRSPFGLRSLSQYHRDHPFVFENHRVAYEPGESTERIKGGNSNWRGPIWFPTNFILIDSLKRLYEALGESFKVETEDGTWVTAAEMSKQLSGGLINLFRQDSSGKRPVHGEVAFFQNDPHWKELVLFYEHYHGDNGRGLGASHQTGWSGVVANLIAES